VIEFDEGEFLKIAKLDSNNLVVLYDEVHLIIPSTYTEDLMKIVRPYRFELLETVDDISIDITLVEGCEIEVVPSSSSDLFVLRIDS
jgi:hypothetical protein